MRPRGPATAVALPIVVLVALLVGYPLFRLGQVLWQEGDGDLARVLDPAGLGEALRSTVLLAAAVTVTAVPLGTGLALVLRHGDLPGRTVLRIAVLLPIAVPDFVLGYSWTQAYARGGFTDSVLGVHWAGLLGQAGRHDEVDDRGGVHHEDQPDAGPATTLLTVTLRLLLPSLAAAAVLVFVLTLASFAIPQVLGTPAGFTTMATHIYADLSRGGDPASFLSAVTLALLLVLVTAVLVAPTDALLGPRLRSSRSASPQGTTAAPGRPAARRAQALGVAGYLVLTVGIPLAALVLSSVTRAIGVPPTPDNWTLGHFRQVLTPRTAEALGHSLALAVAAGTLLVVLGGLVAVLERRRTGRTAATLITLTLVLPGSALAVGLLLAYGRWLSGTLALILLAYLAKLWAFAHRPIAGALDRLPPDELRAGRASGAGPLTAVRTVALRPLAPALAAAWLVCFVTALHEVTMSSLLYGPGSETLAVVVLNSEELGRIGPTAALSVLLSVLVVVPGVLLWWVGSRARTRGAGPVEVPRAG